MSLSRAHPILTSASSGFESSKSLVQLRNMSGRYRSNYLCKHWSSSNKSGICLSVSCERNLETIKHIIAQCNQYKGVRDMMWQKWIKSSAFVIDPTTNPVIISLVQLYGPSLQQHVLFLSRTHCWNIHKKRLEMLDN